MPRRATLRSHLGGRAPGGTGEAGRNAPRWSHVSASAVRALFDSWPQGQVFRKLVELAVSPRAWDRMERELSLLLPDSHHLSTALSVLRYHCDRLETLSTPHEQRCACKSLTRTLNKRARALQRVTEAPAAAAVPPATTVSDWRSADPPEDRRRESSRCQATQSAVRAWQVSHLAGALAPQRAVVTGIGTILGMLADYDFVRHELCPFRHFGIPTRRLRSYWIGSRRIVTLGEARVAGVG